MRPSATSYERRTILRAEPPGSVTPQLTATEILRADDVAALLHVPVSTVYEWARAGRLPSRKRGKHRLFLRPEVEDWIRSPDL